MGFEGWSWQKDIVYHETTQINPYSETRQVFVI
jgi:hypothetical protein